MALASIVSVPLRRRYLPAADITSPAELPFVQQRRRGAAITSYWHLPPVADYGQACALGREYAAHFAQFIKDNPAWTGANLLARIARDIDFADESPAKGCWVGFFAQIERLLHAGARLTDVFADVDQVNAQVAGIEAARNHEAAAREVAHV